MSSLLFAAATTAVLKEIPEQVKDAIECHVLAYADDMLVAFKPKVNDQGQGLSREAANQQIEDVVG